MSDMKVSSENTPGAPRRREGAPPCLLSLALPGKAGLSRKLVPPGFSLFLSRRLRPSERLLRKRLGAQASLPAWVALGWQGGPLKEASAPRLFIISLASSLTIVTPQKMYSNLLGCW